ECFGARPYRRVVIGEGGRGVHAWKALLIRRVFSSSFGGLRRSGCRGGRGLRVRLRGGFSSRSGSCRSWFGRGRRSFRCCRSRSGRGNFGCDRGGGGLRSGRGFGGFRFGSSLNRRGGILLKKGVGLVAVADEDGENQADDEEKGR